MSAQDKLKLNTIESAINDIRLGKVIIVVDDQNRENEGDFVAAAESITPEIINFMATHGRGLICVPITSKMSKKLKLKASIDWPFLFRILFFKTIYINFIIIL